MLIVIRNTPLEYVTVTLTILAPFSLLKDCRQPLSLVLLTSKLYHNSATRTSVLFKIIPSQCQLPEKLTLVDLIDRVCREIKRPDIAFVRVTLQILQVNQRTSSERNSITSS